MNASMLTQSLENIHHEDAIHQLESGTVLFFPEHYYNIIDTSLLSDSILHPTHKNVSYDYARKRLGAYKKEIPGLNYKLESLLRGYAEFSYQLIESVLPHYTAHLQWGRTSFRPAQICGRMSSKRKDDSRLHVDSFSATPVNGLRILRVFCNINPIKEPRVWNLGEPFRDVLEQFAPKIPSYNKSIAHILKWIKTTKTLRSPYDHYMLHLHDAMKQDDRYQAHAKKTRIDFPAHSSWIVFTDHVSHAALSGQYVLEQTFYLPVEHMKHKHYAPLYEWIPFRPELRNMVYSHAGVA